MKWLAFLGFLVVASMVVGCRDEDLDGVERASRVAAARAEAARLHEGASFGIQRWNEVDSVEPLNEVAGFDVVVPRGLPDGFTVDWVVAQPPVVEPNGGQTLTIAVVAVSARAREGVIQVIESSRPPDETTAGTQVAIGTTVGRLSYPRSAGDGSPFAQVAFTGCGLGLGVTTYNLETGPTFTADEVVIVAEATFESCDAEPEGESLDTRYFVIKRDDAVPDLAAFEAQMGIDVTLPTYLPERVTPRFLYGFPLLPGTGSRRESHSVATVYGLGASGSFVLAQESARNEMGEGEGVDVGGVRGHLARFDPADGRPWRLTWEACDLAFSLEVPSFDGVPGASSLADEELIRMAASIVEGCE
ncbi:MAG: hypothetical protein R3C39_11520 [Dehalococcoidia bacterium]